MFVFGDRVVCSAVDLVRAARCEFALLRALDTELGTVAADSATTEAATVPHRQPDPARDRRLSDFRARFGSAMVQISAPQHESGSPETTVTALRTAAEETTAALRTGAPVISGATFFDGSFDCSCDFLVRADHRVRYTVHGRARGRPHRVGAAL